MAQARKKRKGELEKEDNVERWLLTYADMITLLMLFFIVLYSMSTINPAKYMDLAQQLETVFAGGRPEIYTATSMSAGQGTMANPGLFTISKNRSGKKEDIFKQAISALQPNIQARKVRVTVNETGLIITLASDLYFEPGSADIRPDVQDVLQTVSGVIKNLSNDVRIEGHSDDRPIAVDGEGDITKEGTMKYRSNWELASQRAINVLKYIHDFGVDEKRLSAVSYGDTKPLEDGKTPEGRAYNRRVDIVIVQRD